MYFTKVFKLCFVIPFLSSLLLFAEALQRESKRTFRVNSHLKSDQADLEKIIEKNKILSNDYFYHFKPVGSLLISYEYKGDIPVELGNYLSPLETIDSPKITFEAFFPLDKLFLNELYTIVLTDLDPDYEKCHAVWDNLKIEKENVEIVDLINRGSEENDKQYEDDDDFLKNSIGVDNKVFRIHFDLDDPRYIIPYVGPRPKKDTGIHRYVFILFRQPYGKLPFEKLRFRERWGSKYDDHGVGDWANYNQLQPLAFNFFRSSNEGLF